MLGFQLGEHVNELDKEHKEKRAVQHVKCFGLNNQMNGIATQKDRRDREEQLEEKRNQKFSSGHAHLKVPLQYPPGE